MKKLGQNTPNHLHWRPSFYPTSSLNLSPTRHCYSSFSPRIRNCALRASASCISHSDSPTQCWLRLVPTLCLTNPPLLCGDVNQERLLRQSNASAALRAAHACPTRVHVRMPPHWSRKKTDRATIEN